MVSPIRPGLITLAALFVLTACSTAPDAEPSWLPIYRSETEALYAQLAALTPIDGLTYHSEVSTISFEDDVTMEGKPEAFANWQITGTLIYDGAVSGQPSRMLSAIQEKLLADGWSEHPSTRCKAEPCSLGFSRDRDDTSIYVSVGEGVPGQVDMVYILIKSPWTTLGDYDYVNAYTYLTPDPQPINSGPPNESG